MRLIAQAKQGFYPAPPEAIAGVLKRLRRPVERDSRFKVDDLNILDPCAGEAKALVQIAEGHGVSKDHVIGVELNASRAARIAEAYSDIRLLGPCTRPRLQPCSKRRQDIVTVALGRAHGKCCPFPPDRGHRRICTESYAQP